MKIFHLGLMVAPGASACKAFKKHCKQYKALSTGEADVNAKAIAICERFRPDIIFMQIQSPGIIHIETVKSMKATGAYIINWNGDIRHDTPQWMKDMAPYVDRTLFSNMRDARNVHNGGYLEIGYDPEIYKPEGAKLPCKEIVFMGNNYGVNKFPMSRFRIEMHNLLTRHFGNKYGAYGNWSNASGNFNASQYDEAAAYRSAKIGINVSHFEEERYSSDRILRILGTGVFCLCKEYPGMPYIDGVHLRTWRNFPELFQLIRHYLNDANSEERDRIARQGQQYAESTYTFDHMVKNIIKYYDQN